ncbi:MAG TPA: DUF3352 domain-containing protein [Dehalococcoidia bacterium]|nr:DUF3352 domain-containing protein [Dehalococcoidia bacterium]
MLLPLAISLPVIAAVVAALWVLGSSSGQRDKFSSLEIAPHDVDLYMAINTDPASSQWLAVNGVLDTVNATNPILDAIDKALEEFDLEWERDFVPLAGDEGFFAVTDLDALENGGGWVMAFQLRDTGRAEEIFLDIAAQSEEDNGEVLREEEYEGETVYYFESAFVEAAPSGGALAFVEDVSIIGFSRDDVEGVIDVVQGRADSAGNNERLQEMRRRQGDDFLLWAYTDLGRLWDFVEETVKNEPDAPFDAAELLAKARGQADRMSVAVSARRDAFVLDASVLRAPDAEEEQSLARVFDSRFAGTVPVDTMFFAAGYDLFNGTYVPLRDAISETPIESADQQTVEEAINDLEQEIGLNFEEDLLGLLTGEFAVAFNASDFDAEVPGFDMLALFDVSDPERMERSMLKLGDYFEGQELLAMRSSGREGVYAWEPYEGGGDAVAWTVSAGRLAIGFPESGVEKFLEGARPSLADSADWQGTMDLLPDDKTSVVYVSISRLLEEVRRTEGAEDGLRDATDGDLTFDDLMRIRSVGMATTSLEGGQAFSIAVLVRE